MTLKTSLFNAGIYKNTIKRFKWGSFLYFIALFFMVPFALLIQEPSHLFERYHTTRFMGNLLFANDYTVFPMLLSLAVPVVAAALVFHGVHSQKQGIFIHGLPVSRKANYISTLLASFTLMAVPVILNGLILVAMSLNSYSQLFTTTSVICWMLGYTAILFVMFSLSTFTAYVTGNTAAAIIVNVFVHLFPFAIALALFGIGEKFLYGYSYSSSFIGNRIMEAAPLYYFFQLLNGGLGEIFKDTQMWIYIISATVIYILTYFVYKFRKIEACGDVAAFKSFRVIIKYSVVLSATILSLSLLIAVGLGWTVASITTFVVCGIVYFACEMLLSKSFKVFKTYKGYLIFSAIIAAAICFFAFTTVFGYETRVPQPDKVENVVFGREMENYDCALKDGEHIALVMGMHEEFIENRETFGELDERANLYLTYTLKDGKRISRRYTVSREKFEECMNRMFEIKEYKRNVTRISKINVQNVKHFSININVGEYGYGEFVTNGAPQIFEAIEKDIDEMTFTELEAYSNLGFDINLNEMLNDNKTSKVFKEINIPEGERPEFAAGYFNIRVNGNFKNTIEALKKYGYYDMFLSKVERGFRICRIPMEKDRGTAGVTYKGDTGNLHKFYVSVKDCVVTEKEDTVKILEDLLVQRRDVYSLEGEMYLVFSNGSDDVDKMQMSTQIAAYTKEDLPEYIRKYVE